jgi:UDP-N-acetylmuramoylalanine--D-glutamate ligase
VGLARSGAAAALALRSAGREVVGVDTGQPAGARALADAGVELHLGRDGVGLLDRVGTVIKSPGVARDASVIVAARERGLPVLGELELAWRMLANEFIAVTGTNGKTTTVELIGHIHRAGAVPVAVAGNVGAAASGLIGNVKEGVTVVCEASSFQLEDTVAFAPEAAVLLNIAPDHLDRHGTLEAYAAAKLQIFARQGGEDVAVVPSAPANARRRAKRTTPRPPSTVGGELIEAKLGALRARRVRFGSARDAELSLRNGQLRWRGQPLLAADELRLRGRHNVENAMAAAAVCLARGIEPEAVRAGLRSFAGVPHRLEEVARHAGVLFVNDSKATNVASTLVALDAFADSGEGVHLILGGRGKGQDFSALREQVRGSCRAVYLIGEHAPLIAAALDGAGLPVHRCGELRRTIAAATAEAGSGEVVLLSPACASFDQFRDFEARGERFRELVLGG